MGKIKDIYNGENIQVWEDEGFVYVSFPWVVLNFPEENWEEIKKELLEIGEL